MVKEEKKRFKNVNMKSIFLFLFGIVTIYIGIDKFIAKGIVFFPILMDSLVLLEYPHKFYALVLLTYVILYLGLGIINIGIRMIKKD